MEKRVEQRAKEQTAQPGEIRLYTVSELVPILGTSYRTLQNYLRDGRLKGTKIGGKWKVSETNLHHFINGEG